MQKGDDPYEILGVEEDATTSEIRKAYRKLAVVHHPDKQPTVEGREAAHHVFAKIACAYELLSDEEKRKEYDEQQEEGEEEEHPGFDGNATYDYDYPIDPTRNAGSTALVPATDKTGKKFNPFKKKPKKKKPFHFSDPYEVFKRAFKEEFGYEYPGAKWDNIEKTGADVFHRAKNAPLALENGGVGDADGGAGGGEGGDKKKKKGILSIFKGNKKDQQLTVHKGGGQVGKAGYKQPPGNNRPQSMETKTTKIEHDDGTTETITETIITRPDGSVEKMRQTDMPEKGSGNWTKPKEDTGEKKKMLTNGEKGKAPPKNQKKLTNGGKGDGKKKKKAAPKAITNG